MWAFGASKNWEKENGFTQEIVGKMHKERSGTIWLEKREDAYDRENDNENAS